MADAHSLGDKDQSVVSLAVGLLAPAAPPTVPPPAGAAGEGGAAGAGSATPAAPFLSCSGHFSQLRHQARARTRVFNSKSGDFSGSHGDGAMAMASKQGLAVGLQGVENGAHVDRGNVVLCTALTASGGSSISISSSSIEPPRDLRRSFPGALPRAAATPADDGTRSAVDALGKSEASGGSEADGNGKVEDLGVTGRSVAAVAAMAIAPEANSSHPGNIHSTARCGIFRPEFTSSLSSRFENLREPASRSLNRIMASGSQLLKELNLKVQELQVACAELSSLPSGRYAQGKEARGALKISPAATWQPPHPWRNSDAADSSFSRANHNFPFPQALGATFFPAFSTVRFLEHFLDSHPDRPLAGMAPSSHVVIASVTVCAVVAIGVCYLCMRKKRRDGDGYDGPSQSSSATGAAGGAAAGNGETRVPLLFSQDWGDENEDIEQQSFPPSQPSASADQQAAAEAEAAEAARAARQKQWEEERRQAEAEAAEEVAAAAAAANKRARKEGGGRQGRVKFGESTVREYDAGEGADGEGDAEAAAASAAAVAAAAVPDAAAAAKKKAARREGATLVLEVISGPASGSRLVLKNEKLEPWPSATIGRVKANDLQLNDGEVSSKHAYVTWNALSGRWEVVDRGSLNGTLLNDEAINAEADDEGERTEGRPCQLADGDVITCGSQSRILVRLLADTSKVERPCPDAPCDIAIAADPMRARKGGKPLPMEDVPLCEWPLRGLQDMGICCVFDGHAGRQCADNVKRIFPEKLSQELLKGGKHVVVRMSCNATDVLRAAFKATEEELNNEDEGCTATVLLVWRAFQPPHRVWVQAANLGDSHCVLGLGSASEEGVVQMTEDHRLTGPVEKGRLASIGKPMRDGDTRLCGMNIARVFGDKFLKQQDVGLSSDPFIHAPLQLPVPEEGGTSKPVIGVIASDGLWDVMSVKRAIQVALEAPILSQPFAISHRLLTTASSSAVGGGGGDGGGFGGDSRSDSRIGSSSRVVSAREVSGGADAGGGISERESAELKLRGSSADVDEDEETDDVDERTNELPAHALANADAISADVAELTSALEEEEAGLGLHPELDVEGLEHIIDMGRRLEGMPRRVQRFMFEKMLKVKPGRPPSMQRLKRQFQMRIVDVNRTAKVTKGGKVLSFTALVVCGNGQGTVGYGKGKSAEMGLAVDKAYLRALRNLHYFDRFRGRTIAEPQMAKYGKTKVYMWPARKGSGMSAGSTLAGILRLAGFQAVKTKVIGSRHPHNTVKAAFQALSMVTAKAETSQMQPLHISA
ncbi:unnamed protein product [Closterium sp. Yama58-4]|nr:unnamed protein product [Closterium sp. Yama58-4]